MRVTFNYFISEAVFGYILEAVELVAREGWRLLPHYRFEPTTGLWRHGAEDMDAPLALHDIRYTPAGMSYGTHEGREPESRLADYLAEARALLAEPPLPVGRPQAASDLAVGADFEALRWFLMPDEAAAEIRAEAATVVPASEPRA